jgi:hypothetical protein
MCRYFAHTKRPPHSNGAVCLLYTNEKAPNHSRLSAFLTYSILHYINGKGDIQGILVSLSQSFSSVYNDLNIPYRSLVYLLNAVIALAVFVRYLLKG